MKLNNLKTDSKNDKKFDSLLKESKSIQIKDTDILDYSRRLINAYGINEELIKKIYAFGYIEGSDSTSKGI